MNEPHQRQSVGNHHRQVLVSRSLKELPRGGATRLHITNLAAGTSPEMEFMDSNSGKNKGCKKGGRTQPCPRQYVSKGEGHTDYCGENISWCQPKMRHRHEKI